MGEVIKDSSYGRNRDVINRKVQFFIFILVGWSSRRKTKYISENKETAFSLLIQVVLTLLFVIEYISFLRLIQLITAKL